MTKLDLNSDSSARPLPPLAIVGIGCLFPQSAGRGAYWANIKAGTDCISEVPATHWNPDDYFDADPKAPDMTYARRGGFLSQVDFVPLEFGLPPRDLEATDTSQLLGLVAAKQALTDAKIVFTDKDATNPRAVNRARTSVILGVTGTLELVIPLGARLGHPRWKRALHDAGVADDVARDVMERIAESYVPWQENSFPGLLGNVVAGRIANKLDLHGTNCVVDAACASSLSAMHLAALELQTGKSDVVVTGGVDTFNDIFMYMCFSKTPALSPSGNAKPFDAHGDGTILGEGLGMVVLKRLSDAERAGDTIYAVIKGIGTSSDGKGNAIYAPSAEGQKRCLRDAHRQANVTPDTIELLEAHGTGTKVGDAAEASALADVFESGKANRRGAAWCAIGSVKSQIGHTKAAAGAASIIKAALALHHKVLPPTIKVTDPVEPLKSNDTPFYVNTIARPWLPRVGHPRRAGVSAFGFGGSNFHAILEEYTPTKTAPDWDGTTEVLPLCATTSEELSTRLGMIPTNWDDFRRVAAAARNSFAPQLDHRLILVANRASTDLAKLLAGAQSQLAAHPDSTAWQTPEGAYYGRGATPGTIAILFPGQGSQYPGMLRDLSNTFPEMLDTLAAMNGPTEGDERISDYIYPKPQFGTNRRDDSTALRATNIAQPALGAVSYGAWQVLAKRFGISASAFAGHSYGELPALAAGGCLSVPELVQLSQLRGKLMAEQGGTDPGAMLAIFASASDLEELLEQHVSEVRIANRNAPLQTVVSGPTHEIDRFAEILIERRIRSVRLPVAAAFHSPLVADAALPFRQALDDISFDAAQVPVYSNTTARPYPSHDAHACRELLGQQLAREVDFVGLVQNLISAGVRTFVEVGPGSTLTRMVEQIATERSGGNMVVSVALDRSGGKSPGVLDLAHLLARLAARGHTLKWSAWEHESAVRPTAAPAANTMSVALCGANYVQPRPARAARAVPDQTVSTALTVGSVSMSESAPSGDAGLNPSLAAALSATQQTLAALQRMQEQTAQLHKQFLDSQELAQRTLAALVAQQSAALGAMAAPSVPPMMPVAVSPMVERPPSVTVLPPVPSVQVAPAFVSPVMVRPTPLPQVIDPVPPFAEPADTVWPIAPLSGSNGSSHAPTPVQPSNGSVASGAIATALLGVVSEKTGYPVEMLNLGMSLDADLGIDSIKRVEILSTIQDLLPNSPTIKPEHLGTLNTLQDVANLLTTPGTASDSGSIPATELTRKLPVFRPTLLAEVPLASPAEFAIPAIAPVTVSVVAAATNLGVSAALLSVVSEKTGYPAEMLNLGMSLDTDLGIDSIKRVEILSALQERLPDAPTIKPEHLGTLNTLQDVADLLSGTPSGGLSTKKFPIAPVAMQAEPPPTPRKPDDVALELIRQANNKTVATEDFHVSESELAVAATEHASQILKHSSNDSSLMTQLAGNVNDARGELNRPSGSLETVERNILQIIDFDPAVPRSPVMLSEGGEIWIVGDEDEFCRDLATELTRLRHQPKILPWASIGNVKGNTPIAGLVLVTPVELNGLPLNRLAFQWVQLAGPRLRQTVRQGSPAVLLSVARLDGAFGLSNLETTADVTSGGLAGIIKTAKHEWPELTCKAVDLAPEFFAKSVRKSAQAVVDELLAAGPIEVGIAEFQRCTIELARTVRRPSQSGQKVSFTSRDIVLVTGGARGVTAEAAVALAAAFQSTLILTGRTPAPTGPEPLWLAGINEEAPLKKIIAEHLGADATPKSVADQFARVVAQREIRQTIARIEAHGAKAIYSPVNVSSGRAIADLLHQIKVKHGPITGLVHGAGVLADRRIEALSTEQFDYVYTTKVDGARHLLELLNGENLKAIVFFSSTTARLGRTGQLAYAAANEVLNKMAQVESRRRVGTRVVSINWGPWEGGMVTPALRKMFESEGVGLIPLTDGGQFVVEELNAAGKAVEVIAIGSKAATPSGSGATRVPVANAPINVTPSPLSAPNELALAFERTVDVASHPILRSHVLDSRAVLPMAVHMEWIAHAALHGNPGLVFHGFNDLRVTHGVMIDDAGSVNLRLMAGRAVKQDKLFVVPVEIRGRRRDGRDVLHSRAEVVLTAALPKPPTAERLPDIQPYPHAIDDIYRYFLFHGPDMHGIESVEGQTDTAFVGGAYPAPAPNEWFNTPFRSAWVADPLVLDASFQMMILWSFVQHGAGSLPCFLGRYRQFRRSFPAGPTRVAIRITRDNGSFARADIDYLDADGFIVAQSQDFECVIDPGLNQAFRRNQLGPSMVKQ